ncbi:Na(+)/H(+) antiporter subunit C [Demetria terragena]|uniref:Na(+)/H(+) antiporter subunit C n=1 Tax=Demetria terragena TaxID=63959 RepID=UPI000371A9DA|nr:Na(+)/H(+) antiporter subunit C [Demetria terragena]
MTPTFLLIIVCGVLFGCGVYLLLARSVVRALVGLLLIGNGVNLLFMVASGPAGRAPIIGTSDPADQADPVPQAMVLTAIVISLCMTAFMLALAHRSWQLSDTDVLADDTEDVRIVQRAVENDMSDSDFHESGQTTALDDDSLARTTDSNDEQTSDDDAPAGHQPPPADEKEADR